jgi:hypothetical protein
MLRFIATKIIDKTCDFKREIDIVFLSRIRFELFCRPSPSVSCTILRVPIPDRELREKCVVGNDVENLEGWFERIRRIRRARKPVLKEERSGPRIFGSCRSGGRVALGPGNAEMISTEDWAMRSPSTISMDEFTLTSPSSCEEDIHCDYLDVFRHEILFLSFFGIIAWKPVESNEISGSFSCLFWIPAGVRCFVENDAIP